MIKACATFEIIKLAKPTTMFCYTIQYSRLYLTKKLAKYTYLVVFTVRAKYLPANLKDNINLFFAYIFLYISL
jgi:hypothetical protein